MKTTFLPEKINENNFFTGPPQKNNIPVKKWDCLIFLW
jgi:hypothetical protein